MNRSALILFCLGILFGHSGLAVVLAEEPKSAGGESQVKIDFRSQVAPILLQHCLDCHSADLQMAGLRLDQLALAIDGGESGAAIKPGNSAESLLIQRLTDSKLGLRMPPETPFLLGRKPGLPDAQIQILKDWIDQGAQWPADVKLSEIAGGEQHPQQPALFAAIRRADTAAVKAMADLSTLVKVTDQYGSSPLMRAAIYADADLMQVLVEHGADVNHANHDGATALMYSSGDLAKVRLLLDKGAKVDAKSRLGRTPLLVAATYPGNIEVVKLLLARGADAKDADASEETALTSAAKRGDPAMVKALIAAGAKLHAGGRPPLVWAAEEGNVATLKTLLDHGAGKIPPILNAALFSASTRGPYEAVALLLEHGANPKSASKFFGDYTPLMGAVYSESIRPEAAELLIQKGSDVNAKGANGETAVSLATKRRSAQLMKLLKAPRGEAPAEEVLPDPAPFDEAQLRAASAKSVALLQQSASVFFKKTGCISCHNNSATVFAVAEARKHNIPVDEQLAKENLKVTAATMRGFRARCQERFDHPFNSPVVVGYTTITLALDGYAADETTDAMVLEMAARQTADGSWTAYGHRPPIEYSRISSTAIAIRAMQLYGPPGQQQQLAGRIERGRQYLIDAKPTANAEEAFRLLGLAWSDADPAAIKAQAEQLLHEQHGDGAWSQHPYLGGDALATGLTLYALRESGQLKVTEPAYRKAVAWLLKTQLEDGSWHVKTRSFPIQTYFESGFPHGHDQWISAQATGFASMALMSVMK